MFSVVSAATLLLVGPLCASTNLSDALEALEANEPLGKISLRVGLAATRRIRSTTEDEQLERLVKIAQAGRAQRALGQALVVHIGERGAGQRVAVRALAAFPERLRHDLTERPPKLWTFNLKRLLERTLTPATDGAVLTLLVPHASVELLSRLYRRWRETSPARAELLLSRLGGCRPAQRARVLELLTRFPPAAAHLAALVATCRALARDLAIGTTMVTAAERGDLGPHDVFLHVLGAVPPSLWKRATRVTLGHLTDLEEEAESAEEQARLAAAVLTAAQLRCPDVLDRLPLLLSSPTPSRIRIAAVQALALVAYRDGPTIDRLIKLLGDADPAVAEAAYGSLKRKAAVRLKLPMRPDVWQAWRRSQKLPDQAPEPVEERLAKQRSLLAVQFKLKYRPKPAFVPPPPGKDDHDHDDAED